MIKLEITPSSMLKVIQQAQLAGVPQGFTESDSGCNRTFRWFRDGSDTEFEITLERDGTWRATMELGQ